MSGFRIKCVQFKVKFVYITLTIYLLLVTIQWHIVKNKYYNYHLFFWLTGKPLCFVLECGDVLLYTGVSEPLNKGFNHLRVEPRHRATAQFGHLGWHRTVVPLPPSRAPVRRIWNILRNWLSLLLPGTHTYTKHNSSRRRKSAWGEGSSLCGREQDATHWEIQYVPRAQPGKGGWKSERWGEEVAVRTRTTQGQSNTRQTAAHVNRLHLTLAASRCGMDRGLSRDGFGESRPRSAGTELGVLSLPSPFWVDGLMGSRCWSKRMAYWEKARNREKKCSSKRGERMVHQNIIPYIN